MTAEVLVAPAADGVVVAYLLPLLNPVPVSTDVRDPRPSKFVRVLLTGGAGRRSTVLHDAQITVEAWADSYSEASTLMMLADAHMHAARRLHDGIYDVASMGAPVNLPDPLSGQSRLTATYQVTLRVSAL